MLAVDITITHYKYNSASRNTRASRDGQLDWVDEANSASTWLHVARESKLMPLTRQDGEAEGRGEVKMQICKAVSKLFQKQCKTCKMY